MPACWLVVESMFKQGRTVPSTANPPVRHRACLASERRKEQQRQETKVGAADVMQDREEAENLEKMTGERRVFKRFVAFGERCGVGDGRS